jgi:hypothetical protein
LAKIMYIAKRKPGFTPEAFTARWRQHGALAMSHPMWRNSERYVQASVMQPAPMAGASDEYDAVGALWLYDDAPLVLPNEEHLEYVAMMARDEEETFAHYIGPVCMAVDEEVLKDGANGPVTAYAFFDDAQAARRFAKAAAEAETGRVALNTRSKDAPRELLLTAQAIVEVSANDEATLARALEGPGLARADLAVVARDAVLWPKAA